MSRSVSLCLSIMYALVCHVQLKKNYFTFLRVLPAYFSAVTLQYFLIISPTIMFFPWKQEYFSCAGNKINHNGTNNYITIIVFV